jgi:hypothetical protein
VEDAIVCEVVDAEDGTATRVPLRPEAGSAREEKAFEGAILLPYRLSDRKVRLEFTARDLRGAETLWTSQEFELPSIARPRPERIGVQLGEVDVEPMRLVRGNGSYPYLFGGRGDAIENADFVRAGLEPFNRSPRKTRPRSWQIEYAAGAIEDFYLDEREVSVSQYLAFLRDPRGYADPGHWVDGKPGLARFEELAAALAATPADSPVTGVTWHEATAYAHWAGKRLPSWVEWEFAVRGGGEYRAFSSDDKSGSRGVIDRIAEATSGAGAPVRRGSSGDWTPNDGIADLCTNVSEWTSTAAAFEGDDDRRHPHLWARDHAESLLRPSRAVTDTEYWIVGGSIQEPRLEFAVADHRPAGFTDKTAGFRCAVSLRDVQERLGSSASGGPYFEVLP